MAATQPADRRCAADSSDASAKRWDGGRATPATSAKVCAEEIHGGGVVRVRGIAGGGCAHGRKKEDKNVIKEGTWEGPRALADLFYTHTASSQSDRSFVHDRLVDNKHFPSCFMSWQAFSLSHDIR
jgi:hypothetical protein